MTDPVQSMNALLNQLSSTIALNEKRVTDIDLSGGDSSNLTRLVNYQRSVRKPLREILNQIKQLKSANIQLNNENNNLTEDFTDISVLYQKALTKIEEIT